VEEQIPSSNFPPDQQMQGGQITPDQLEQIKARAREAAILQTYAQQQKPVEYQIGEPLPPGPYAPIPSINPLSPKIVYVKRSLTVAEIILMLLLSCGIVFGVQVGGGFLLNNMPRIEIKLK
jgi:hypothetical protein